MFKFRNSEYYNFIRLCYNVPEYIKKNLKNMPNNKGYIWKGIQLFGEKPKEEDTVILFENIGHNFIRIHEITKKEYKIYEKKDKEKRKLISKEKRRIINGSEINV